MLASQLIYTACGKDKTGAFSVWSKSADVTKEESDEIVKLMSYRKPNNSPYEPTEEELRTLFPKKYCYCTLSSGRKCIALTTYVGKVYSDMDARNGNFVIHAFIFKDLEGFNPFGFMKLNLFRTSLSYTEWHDNPAPQDLPVVEIEANPSVDENTIRSLLTGTNKHHYVSLLQAVIDAARTDATVTFNDTEENQVKIYSLIGALLPSCLFGTTSFSNQYLTQLDYSLSSNGMKPVKIRNIFPDLVNTSFNYQEQLDAGQSVFNFGKGICSSIQPKRYLADIVQSFEVGNSLFAILKKIDKVNTIMKETGCDIDVAIAIYYLIQKDLNWFSGAEEFSKAFSIATERRYVDETAIAICLYKDIILTDRWGRGSSVVALAKYAYAHNDQAVKSAIMDKYFNELPLYGINVSAPPASVLTQIKDSAPFPWNDFVVAVVRNPAWDRYVDRCATPAELYFVFDAAVLAVSKNSGDADSKVGCGILVKIVKKALARRAFDEFKLYLDCAAKLGDNTLGRLVEASLEEYVNGIARDESTLDFAFHVVCCLNNEQEKVKYIGKLISSNVQSSFFMPTYIKYSEQYPSLFARIENIYKSDKSFSEFLFRKDAYVFRNNTRVTYNSLSDYFRKYYQAGYDSGVYVEKVRQYLASQPDKAKAPECMKIYDQVKRLSDTFADVLDVLECIDREIFSLTIEDLLNITQTDMGDIIELNSRLSAARRRTPERYELLCTILMIRGKFGEKKFLDAIQSNDLYGNLSRNQLDNFVSKYFGEVLDLYCRCKKKKYCETKTLLIAIFDKPLTSCDDAQDGIIQAMEKLGDNDYYALMADIMAYAFNANSRFASELMIFAQSYIEKMKKGDYRKLFKKVVEIMPKEDVPAVQKYIDKYQDDHMGFFEKLFSKKK